MKMPRGGVFDVAPGQVTDDSELALCLALGLLDGGSEFSLDAIANRYQSWISSSPFDVGRATQSAFDRAFCAGEMQLQAVTHNVGSKANGSLMRCMPLAVWGHRLPQEQLVKCAMLDSSLSHPNPTCQIAVACYVSAASALVRGEDTSTALAAAHNTFNIAGAAFAELPGTQGGQFDVVEEASREVQAWLVDACAGEGVAYTPQDGFVRIAFTHAFRHLKEGTRFEDAAVETLSGFGDTDTNTAIVCGLLGARYGLRAIPKDMWTRVIACKTELGRLRPHWLSMSQLPEVVLNLTDIAPDQLDNLLPDLKNPFDNRLQDAAASLAPGRYRD